MALADGTIFRGLALGFEGQTVGEVVFNTSMTGYQEIITDPSYAEQLITLTYPHIGNVGVNPYDNESAKIYAAGLIIRDNSLIESNWRSTENLDNFLKRQRIVAISDIDTRHLTRIIRDKGAQSGCIMTGNEDPNVAIEHAKSFSGLNNKDLAQLVSTKETYSWCEGVWDLAQSHRKYEENELPYHVVAYDFGIKLNILRLLVDRGCKVTVVPAKTSAKKVLSLRPDGVFLSNGPGDPAPCDYAITAIKEFLVHNTPIFGICLGHQLLALASGAKTIKMKFGHHGANHPVKDCRSNAVLITSQNHGFTVSEDGLPKNLEVTHRSLFDNSIQGIRLKDKPAFSFQGHPEASPGPHDVVMLFDQFINLMQEYKNQNKNNLYDFHMSDVI